MLRKTLFTAALVLSCFGVLALVQDGDQTWTGRVSDSRCGAKHMTAAEHGGKQMSDAECVSACVHGGAKYVIVTDDGKIYQIKNQDFVDLPTSAAEMVTISGNLAGDTITVTKIAAKR